MGIRSSYVARVKYKDTAPRSTRGVVLCTVVSLVHSFSGSLPYNDVYLDMLQEFAVLQLEHLQPDVTFQQDGAPTYWPLNVCQILDDKFPDRWIGQDGPILWPPRLPDFTALDFFLWGFVKDQVHRTRVTDLKDLEDTHSR